MKALLRGSFALAAFVGLASAPACQPSFPGVESSQQLSVTITAGDVGTASRRLDISFSTPSIFTVDIQAIDANGNLDSSFNGYVRALVIPGAVASVTGPSPGITDGRNVLLTNGEAKGIQIGIVDSYGDTRIQIEDVGYVPADPLSNPHCANGIDDNHNGKIDYPNDPGCYAANDNTEDGGTYAAAVSDAVYFRYPRIADVRGAAFGGSTTPFPSQQVQMDTEWVAPGAPGGVVVTGVGAAGFYVTDISRGPHMNEFTSVYAYTYSAPPIMLPCDRLISFGGTAGEFFGFTEINYPTWSLEEWDPTVRKCLVPEPITYLASDLANTTALIAQEAALVRVASGSTTVDGQTISTAIHVGADFGPGLVPQGTGRGSFTPTSDASDCDYNGDGKIDYTVGSPEDLCATNCTADVECTEYSQYLAEAQFRLVVVTTTVTKTGKTVATGTITADATADASFVPTEYKAKPLGAFTGNLLYFSGGSTFTIQARCADDVVTDPSKEPLPSSKACVVARNAAELTNAN